ncbi:hypothetical protein LIER_06169 [Lithospermum erythrorhizon]|uniref:Uncharacterized protein n=1 Tax=Lithospermum erythrorhizon TaxID=34254 RepID=A0AAV3P3J0_LITER
MRSHSSFQTRPREGVVFQVIPIAIVSRFAKEIKSRVSGRPDIVVGQGSRSCVVALCDYSNASTGVVCNMFIYMTRHMPCGTHVSCWRGQPFLLMTCHTSATRHGRLFWIWADDWTFRPVMDVWATFPGPGPAPILRVGLIWLFN